MLLAVFGAVCLPVPFIRQLEKVLGANPFLAGRDDNNRPSLCYCRLTILQRFLRLVEVFVQGWQHFADDNIISF